MARPFRYTIDRRIVNTIIMWLLNLGFEPDSYYLLTVTGRKSGKTYTLPVVIVDEGPKRWLVAPYGVMSWVKNARASGMVTLRRGKRSQNYAIQELPPGEAAPVLREYLKRFPITQPYFDAQPDSNLDVFEVEAQSRPVFELHAQNMGKQG